MRILFDICAVLAFIMCVLIILFLFVFHLHIGSCGRYQLFQGTYSMGDFRYSGHSSQHKELILVDTMTGNVKEATAFIDKDGELKRFWADFEMGAKK